MTLLKILFLYLIYLNFLYVLRCSSPTKISIIIPVYNSEPYLLRSMQSVLNQTLTDIEIICIDDASTDHSLEMLNEYKAKDHRIKVIHMEENKGPAICRNTGINIAKGEFVGFIDSDDYIDNRFYEYLYNYTKNYDIVVGTFVNSVNGSENFIHHRIFTNIEGFIWDSIFRRSFLDNHNLRFPTNLRYMEDTKFRKDCYEHNPRIFKTQDEGIYYYYKQREGSLCNRGKNYIKNLSRKIKNAERKNKIKMKRAERKNKKKNEIIKFRVK